MAVRVYFAKVIRLAKDRCFDVGLLILEILKGNLTMIVIYILNLGGFTWKSKGREKQL